MKKFIDSINNRVTMYRLVLCILIILDVYAVLLGAIGLISYTPVSIIFSNILIISLSWVTNKLFSSAYKAPVNVESVYITALILVLILPPLQSSSDLTLILFASVLSMASKYILAYKRKHIFNPAAIAVVLTAIGFGGTASWWVGNIYMTPLVVAGGLLVAYKLQRMNLYLSFVHTVLLVGTIFTMISGSGTATFLNQVVFRSSMFFLAGIMLTEPLTIPPTTAKQNIYGVLVGFLFLPQIHVGSLYTTPELALVLGNIYSFSVSPKTKLWLTMKEKIKTSKDTWDFIFTPGEKVNYKSGQYMEWTLEHKNPDSRGNRRYFTLASSPTEDELRIGVKFFNNGSSYKRALMAMEVNGVPIVASQISGSFTLPKDTKRKLIFIAGGIGITPYRSMIKFLSDTKQDRDIILVYSVNNPDEIAYKDTFENTSLKRLKVIFKITNLTVRINKEFIINEVEDYKERLFYLSGPDTMVNNTERLLKDLGISAGSIKKDYFPGLV